MEINKNKKPLTEMERSNQPKRRKKKRKNVKLQFEKSITGRWSEVLRHILMMLAHSTMKYSVKKSWNLSIWRRDLFQKVVRPTDSIYNALYLGQTSALNANKTNKRHHNKGKSKMKGKIVNCYLVFWPARIFYWFI